MRILTTNNFKYKKIAATDPYRQAAKIVQNLNGVLQKYWKDINKYGKNPVYIQNLTQTLLANLNKTNVAFTSLGIPMGQQISPIIGNLVSQLQTNLQQIGTGMPGSLQPDGSVVQPIDLNDFGTILQEFNQNLSGAMYTETKQYGQQQQQALEQRQMEGQQGQQEQQGQAQEPGQAPQQGQGQQPQQPGQNPQQRQEQRGGDIPTPEEIDWDKLYRQAYVTKGNIDNFIINYGGLATSILSDLQVPPDWYGANIAKETTWPSTDPQGWLDSQGKHYSQAKQRSDFATGLEHTYTKWVKNDPQLGHNQIIKLLGPGGLGITFNSYKRENEGEDPHSTSKQYKENPNSLTGGLLDTGRAMENWGNMFKGEGSMY